MAAKNPLIEVLERVRWDPAVAAREVEIEIHHRGAEGDRRRLTREDLSEVGPHGIVLRDGSSLPIHRIRRIRIDGETVWSRLEPRP